MAEEDVTVQTPKGPLKVPDYLEKMGSVVSVTLDKEGAQEPVKEAPKRHKYTIDGHNFTSDHLLSTTEIQQLRSQITPPLSQVTSEHPFLATAARVATPVIGGAIGAASPIPGGTAIGAGIGGAIGETLAEKLEGRSLNPREIAAQTVISATFPGPGKTVLSSAVKAGLHGAGSITLDSLARTGELPSAGEVAIGTLLVGATTGAATKLMLRSSLRELMPTEVADATHEVLTTGKLSTPITKEIAPSVAEDITEAHSTIKRLARDSRGRFVKSVEEEPVSKPTVRVKLAEDPSKYEFSGAGEPPTSTQKFRWKRVGKGEYVKEYITPGSEASQPSVSKGTTPETPDEEIPRPKGTIGWSRTVTPQIWLFDRIQKETKLPVYSEVYLPIREAVESGDRGAIKKVTREVESKYLQGKTPIPDDVKHSIRHVVNMARGYDDGVIQDLENSYRKMFSKLGVNRWVSDRTAREFAINTVTLQYAGPLPGRVGPILRNSAQSLQTGYMFLGERWYWAGVKGAMSRGGIKRAESMGFLTPERSISSEVQQGTSWYSKLIRAGFWPYRKVDDLNNSVMGIGQYERTMWAARKAKGNVAQFVSRANLETLPKAEQDIITNLYSKGLTEQAALRAGKIRANITQFLYGPTERPEAISSTTLGRTVGGYGNWPAFYGQLLKNTFMNPDVPTYKKAIMGARMVAAHGALGVGAGAIYEAYGYDKKRGMARALDFVGPGPLFYSGGAVIDVARGMEETARKAYEEQRLPKGKDLWRTMKPVVPFGYAYSDLFGDSPVGQYPKANQQGYITRLRKTMEDR